MSSRVAIVGGGHNALVAATYLARAGARVEVLERLGQVGGAAVSVRAFPGVEVRLSRYSYLVSLLPAELVADLGLDIELRSRSTASVTPYVGASGPAELLVETAEGEATAASFRALTGGDGEYRAWREFYREVATLARAVAPTLLRPLPRAREVRGGVDPRLWSDLVTEPLGRAIEARFAHDVVRGVVATDALIGTFASMHAESLIQNRCFLYHLIGNGTGEWRVPVGGMGNVTAELERVAKAAGATIRTGATVTSIDAAADGVRVHGVQAGAVAGSRFTIEADWVLSGVAPYALAELLGEPATARGPRPVGSQLKVNLVLERLPRLRSGIAPEVAFAGTMHLNESLAQVERAYAQAARASAPALPDELPGEIYCHTLTDRTILSPDLDAAGVHTLTYFGLHTPQTVLTGPTAHADAWQRVLAGLQQHLAEPLEPLILRDATGQPCIEVKTPGEIEAELAMPGGNIFHGDLAWPWLEDDSPAATSAERWGVATNHPRVLMAGSGARRGGAVSGIAGHNAAHALLEML